MNPSELLERIKREEVLEERVVRQVCKQVEEVLLGESNLLILSSPIILVGDIHGQFYDVLKLLTIGSSITIQEERFQIISMYSLETLLIVDTTPYKQFYSSSAWSFSILNVYGCFEETINLGIIPLIQTNFLHLWLSRRNYSQIRECKPLESIQ